MNLYQSVVEILHNEFEVPITTNASLLREDKEPNYPDSELKMSGKKCYFNTTGTM